MVCYCTTFGTVEGFSGVDEQLDDVTAEARYRRRRFGSNVPTEIRKPETERYNTHQLEAALRRRSLPWHGDGWEVLEKRLQTSIVAEQAIYDAGFLWNTVESFLGTDRKARLADALDVASSAAETLSGDLFGALGAGFMSGATEIAGVGELLKGDWRGAMEKRKEEASTEDGRLALQQKADAAVKRAKQQAMIRLAHGMELMSVRKGAWKMLQQAIEDEGPRAPWAMGDASAERCELAAEELLREGHAEAAALRYERALQLRLKACEAPSQLALTAEALAKASNHACKDFSAPQAERQLQRSLRLLDEVLDLQGAPHVNLLSCINLTLANLASLHQRAGRRTMALKLLREAEALGASITPAEAAATQLSLCALLSQLGRHPEAEQHAAQAVSFAEADVLQQGTGGSVTREILREKASTLAVAYNNLAVQREYLGHEDCLALYEKAIILAEGHMEKDNPLLATLQGSHRNALQMQVERKSKHRPSSSTVRAAKPETSHRPRSAVEPRRRPQSASVGRGAQAFAEGACCSGPCEGTDEGWAASASGGCRSEACEAGSDPFALRRSSTFERLQHARDFARAQEAEDGAEERRTADPPAERRMEAPTRWRRHRTDGRRDTGGGRLAAVKIQRAWACFQRKRRRRVALWLQASLRCQLAQVQLVKECRAARTGGRWRMLMLAYLEAPSTNTECWIWRFKASKRLVVAWRGTSDFGDVLTDIAAHPRIIRDLGKVHEGFSRAYDSIRAALHATLARGVRGDGEGWEIIFTGHSLGGALATLSSVDVARTIRGLPAVFGQADEVGQVEEICPLRGAQIVNVTFGAPRVGGARLCVQCDEYVPRTWRVFSTSDVVPTVPPKYLWGFLHAGIGVELDPQKSTLTKLRESTEADDKSKLEGSSLMLAFQESDIWSSFNGAELAELRRVLGTGTQSVSEHMEEPCLLALVAWNARGRGVTYRRIRGVTWVCESLELTLLPQVPPSRSDTVVQVEAEVPTVTFEVPAAQEEVSDAPAWSSLSAEDRMRFGLEGAAPPRHTSQKDGRLQSLNHPDVLWGNAGMPGPPSMAKTMAQLEAVGMASNLLQLEEGGCGGFV
eukprot:g9425.t1